jgi:hypothetical protein
MPKRLLTFFLLLTVLVPTSLLGSTLHRCSMMDGQSMDRGGQPSCCAKISPLPQENDGAVHLSHQCDISPGAIDRQPATTTFKSQYESPYPAECVPETIVSHLSSEFLSRFPAGASYFPFVGNRQPVFLRNCSFLI